MRPASISERIRADCAQKRSDLYKKEQALRHFDPPNQAEDTVFDYTTFGQRDLLIETDWTTECPEEKPQEDLDGVLDL